jgi:hypothetical protein
MPFISATNVRTRSNINFIKKYGYLSVGKV